MQVKHGRHEVFRAGVFVETTDEISDCRIKLVGVHHRGVENQRADCFPHGICLVRRHPDQHFEINVLPNAAAFCQQMRVRQIEEVVSRNPHSNGFGVGGTESPLNNSLVVGVRFFFTRQHGDGPVVQRGIDLLHLQIGALHHSNLQLRATSLHTLRSEFIEPLHRVQSLRQIRLDDNAAVVIFQALAVEDLLEHIEGHLEVAILLHVQVDKRRRRGSSRFFIEGHKGLDHALNSVVVAPHRQLGHDRRHLH
ncbi:MAG: Uncharacterised protein [Cellulomonadaceae bacterium TMED98]|nr:MAG: Uncharacterised protein [Cellulomonadaceae bacterium TMED98]